MRVAIALLLVALVASCQARSFDSVQQSDDGTTVVRMHFESNDDSDEQPIQMTQSSSFSSQSAFSSPFSILSNLRFFSRPEPQPEQPRVFITSGLLNNDFEEKHNSISRMFDNLFRFSSFGRNAASNEEDDTQSPSIISFEMEPTVTFADEQEDDETEPDLSAPLSRMFARMNSLLHPFFQSSNDQFFRTQETNVPKSPRRGGCNLLQRCAADIERLCASAKRINIAQAIPRCLARHRDELSEQCGDYMDRRAAGMADDEEDESASEEAESETVVSEESTEATPMVPVPTESSEAPIPSDPREACHLAVSSLCPSVNHENMVDLMACLHSHQSEVNSVCLTHVKDTAAFACAEDAQKLCPGVTERRAVGRCLKEHVSQLSNECIAATRPKTSPVTGSIKIDNLAERVAVPATPSLAADSKQTYMIAGGLVGLVALVVVGAIVVARRRARRTTAVKAVVQLVNPNHQNSAVGVSEPASSDTYSAAFGRELRPEEQL